MGEKKRGRKPKDFYKTFRTASNAFQRIIRKFGLNKDDIKTARVFYELYYRQDLLLPSAPETVYKKEWAKKGSWKGFMRIEEKKYYAYDEALKAVQNLSIIPTTELEYRRFRKKDLRLPPAPQYTYPDFYMNGGWNAFLGKNKFQRESV